MSSSQILYAINKNKVQAPVSQTLESAIQRINHFSVDKYKVTNCAIHCWIEICRVDTLSIRYRCNATYTLVGNSTQECNDGRWTNSTPSCNGWQCSYIKIADLLVVFFKNWQADVVTWEIRVTSKDILPKKSLQNDFSQLKLWLLLLSSRDIPFNEISNLRLIFSQLKDHHW